MPIVTGSNKKKYSVGKDNETIILFNFGDQFKKGEVFSLFKYRK